jgi:sigma-B regulation protein RsbU (phosphoserine phosphatase)
MTSDARVMDVSRDWAIACQVQQRFMRGVDQSLEAFDFSGGCRQMLELGGDCYDFVPLRDDRLALTVGDASGKSVAAALMISNVQSSLRTAMTFCGSVLAATLRIVNRQVYSSSLPGRYATLFYGVIDAPTRTLRYVNAGHNPPVVIRQDGSVDWLETGGAPLGMFGDSNYEEGCIRLNPGDVVVAYTDGIIEATNSTGEEWGVEGLLHVVSQSRTQCAEDIVHAIFTAMDEYSREHPTDDATVTVLRAL